MCKEISTGEILAMKVLKKEEVIADDDCEAVLAENNVLRRIKHPFVTVGHAASYNKSHSTTCTVLILENTLMPGLVAFIILIYTSRQECQMSF